MQLVNKLIASIHRGVMPKMQSASVALLLISSLSVWSQATPNKLADENAFMEAQAKVLGYQADLRATPRGPDGIRAAAVATLPGHYYFTQPRIRVFRPNGEIDVEHSSPFQSVQEADMHGFYCRANKIVIARSLGSQVRITENAKLIYTKTTFVVAQILKSGTNTIQETYFTILTPGGIVTVEGETLSLKVYGGVPYTDGALYLLTLPSHPDLAEDNYLLSSRETIAVEDSRIRPLGLNVRSFLQPMESLAALKQQWASLTDIASCPRQP